MLATIRNETRIERRLDALFDAAEVAHACAEAVEEYTFDGLLASAAKGDASEVVDHFDGQDKLGDLLVLFARHRLDPNRLGLEILRECSRMFDSTATALNDTEFNR